MLNDIHNHIFSDWHPLFIFNVNIISQYLKSLFSDINITLLIAYFFIGVIVIAFLFVIYKTSKFTDQRVLRKDDLIAVSLQPSYHVSQDEDRRPINPPFAYSTIEKEESGRLRYVVIEPALTEQGRKYLNEIRRLLFEEIDVNLETLKSLDEAERYLREKVQELAENHRFKLDPDVLEEIDYYIIRDSLHYRKIDVLMRDPLIEDVSCDGPDVPIYVWHRECESMPTNVVLNRDELDAFIMKLAYSSGRHISIASPMLDASLPDGNRIQLTFRKEVTRKGSTFTIRKFKEDPLTITDLIINKTLTSGIAAFLWYLIEKGASILVAGGTASGKTTTLNTLSLFLTPDSKVISIEDTPELNIPHENWISSIERTGFGVRSSEAEITMFELLRAAIRQRPDFLIVGEVRGAEAYNLFQAMATGHGGMGSIHGESPRAVINRLTTEPMNIPLSLIPTLNVIVMQTKVKLRERIVRRITSVTEPIYDNRTDDIVFNDVFQRDPESDSFYPMGQSLTLEKFSQTRGENLEYIMKELETRKRVLDMITSKRIRSNVEVSQVIRDYYINSMEAIAKLSVVE